MYFFLWLYSFCININFECTYLNCKINLYYIFHVILPIYERFRWSRKSAHIGVTIFNYTWHSGQKWFKKLQFGGLLKLKAIKSPKLKTFMFHIVRNTHYWIGTQNYECQILMEKRPFFKAKWPYSLQIFSLVSLVKKSATCKAIWPWK